MLQDISTFWERWDLCGISPPNCTSWKQPYDQGIVNALKTRYKLHDVLSFYKVNEDKNHFKRTRQKLRRGSEGVRFGNPVHLLDAAKYAKEAGDNTLPISIESCFTKADMSIELKTKRTQSKISRRLNRLINS
jgi:hypothetical protein